MPTDGASSPRSRDNRVATGHVHVRDGLTAYTDIAFGDGGERIIAFEEFGVCAGYRPTDAEIAMLRRLRHVHIGWLDDGGALKQALAAAGTSVSQDLSVTSPAAGRRADGLAVAFASAGPSVAEGEALAARLLADGARTAVVTCGAAGSVASDGKTMARMDARPVEVVDTLGAGDTFIAGFLAARLDGRDLERVPRGRPGPRGRYLRSSRRLSASAWYADMTGSDCRSGIEWLVSPRARRPAREVS